MDIKCACGRRLDINRLGKEYISCTCGDSYLFCIVFECRKTTWSTNTVRRQDTCREQIIYESAPNSKITIFPSIDLDKKEKLAGSLFGKLASYDWGEDEGFNIDALVESLQSHVA